MNTITNEESNFPTEMILKKSPVQKPKTAKVSGMLSLVLAGMAMISIFLPFGLSDLFWFFLLFSAALAVFGFLEVNSGNNWLSTITWLTAFILLFLLFTFAVNLVGNPKLLYSSQSLYFYGAFSIIVPILLTLNGLIAKSSPVWKSFTPLLIPAVFIFSLVFLTPRAVLLFLLLLPIGWGLLGILTYSESKN